MQPQSKLQTRSVNKMKVIVTELFYRIRTVTILAMMPHLIFKHH